MGPDTTELERDLRNWIWRCSKSFGKTGARRSAASPGLSYGANKVAFTRLEIATEPRLPCETRVGRGLSNRREKCASAQDNTAELRIVNEW